MKNGTAIIFGIVLGGLSGGLFWWATSGSSHNLGIIRIGLTVALTLTGIVVGYLVQVSSLGDWDAKYGNDTE